MRDSYSQLTKLMQDFISGKEQSLEYVNKIEELLIKDFQDNHDIFDPLSEPLASYRPVGGDQLYNEADLAETFKTFLKSNVDQ